MQTIRGIGRFYLTFYGFVHAGRAERNARPAESWGALLRTDIYVYNPQVTGLLLAMLGCRHCGEGVLIKVLIGF